MTPQDGQYGQLGRFLHEWLSTVSIDSPLPGVSIAITKSGQPVFQGAYGARDIDSGEPLLPTTQVEVASQSKMLTTVATLLLVERGALDLHAPVATYVPEIVEVISGNSSFTVYDLLTHQAGLPRDFVAPLGDDPLDAVKRTYDWSGPNEKWRYSNLGFAILGEVVRRVSGEPFREFVMREVVAACDMSLTSFDANPAAQQSTPHGPLRRGKVESVGHYSDSFDGVSGVWSTPTDMCQLVRVFSATGLLSKALRTMATATQWGPTRQTFGASFAVGLEVRTLGGQRWLGHTGGAPGFVSGTFFCPDTDWAFSVVFNSRALRELDGVVQTLGIAIDEWESTSGCDATERFEPFTGLYNNEAGYLHVARTPRRCIDINPSDWNPLRAALDLQYESATSLRISGGDFNNAGVKLEFTPDSKGHMQSVTAAGLTYVKA